MLAEGKVKEIRRLLSEGQLSQRKIASLVGISRATVGAIAAGRRPDYALRRRIREEEFEPLGPIERCPGCGGLVHVPCRLCRIRALKDHQFQALRQRRRRARELAARRVLLAVLRAARRREAQRSAI